MSGAVAIAGGGTGGHLFAARALAESLQARGRRVMALTDARGADFLRDLPGVATHPQRASPIMGRGLAGKVAGAAELLVGCIEARALLRRLRPSVVVGFGGYASVPPVLAARWLRIPTAIHEQNAVLGRANRLLAPRVDLVALSFESTVGIEAERASRVAVTGNPVRAEIAALAPLAYAPPTADGVLKVLVFGGSQGASILARVVPSALRLLPETARRRLAITQQCRSQDLDALRESYAELGLDADIATFFDDMARRLSRAHLVICRAGASTLAELAVAGRPAILVPYRLAADDHQLANARVAEARGAGWSLREEVFGAEALAARLETLMACPSRLEPVSAAAREGARPGAAGDLADLVERLVPAADESCASCRPEVAA